MFSVFWRELNGTVALKPNKKNHLLAQQGCFPAGNAENFSLLAVNHLCVHTTLLGPQWAPPSYLHDIPKDSCYVSLLFKKHRDQTHLKHQVRTEAKAETEV